jgi:hypothetical protein
LAPSPSGENPSGIFNGILGITNKVGFLIVSFGDTILVGSVDNVVIIPFTVGTEPITVFWKFPEIVDGTLILNNIESTLLESRVDDIVTKSVLGFSKIKENAVFKS